MSNKDPFAEPNDNERTVIRPNPGGRRPAGGIAPTPPGYPQQPGYPPQGAYPGQPQPPQQPAPGGQDAMADPMSYGVPQHAQAAPAAGPRQDADGEAALALSMTGMNTLNACAATLFSLIGRIRNRAQHMDADKLRQSVIAEVRAFENRALQAGIEAQTVKAARYALCATLDDVVLNTPWGGQSSWAVQSMVATFHRETVGGDRFYDLLARLEQAPGPNIDMLEFLYMCLSLGFEGRLRVEQGGSDKHLQIRNGLARIIRGQRGPVERDLSPHWEGLDMPHKPLSAWKAVWIAAGVATVVMGLGYAGLSYALGVRSERLIGQLSALESTVVPELQRRAPPPPPPPPQPESESVKVAEFLKPEIEEGLVTVIEKGNVVTVRIAGAGMFGSGSDQVKDEFLPKLARVATALNDSKGPIIVVGHSDNVPIKSSRFPSNMHLSLARAESVMKVMALGLTDTARMTAEGRADKEPIEPNDTKEGRAKNRRIEVLLVKADG